MIQTYMIFYSIKIFLLFPNTCTRAVLSSVVRPQFLFLFLSLPHAAPCLWTLQGSLESPPHGRQEGGGIKWDMVAHGGAWWDRLTLQASCPSSQQPILPGLVPRPRTSTGTNTAHCTLRCTLHCILHYTPHYTLHRASTSSSTSQRGARRCSSGPRHRAPLLYGPGCVVRYSLRYSVQ